MVNNILIVDDIGKNIQVLASILVKEDYAISYATNGNQALEMVKDENYDLILLDIMMPGMDGFEVCKHIKQLPDKDDIPIIFLTARSEKQDIAFGFKSGAVDYITKPFNSAELKARVETHLQLKKAKDRIAGQNDQLKKNNEDLEKLNQELQALLKQIQTLEGIIPICSYCKNIRDDEGYWKRIEEYMTKHSRAKFSHGICPDCMKKHFPDDDF